MKHIFYHLAAVMVVVVWGMTFISTKVLIVHGLSPQEIFLFRFLLAYAAVCPISFHRFFARNLKDELYLVGGGVLGGSLFFFLQNMALGLTQASNVSFIICTTPLLTAALTVLSVPAKVVDRMLFQQSIFAAGRLCQFVLYKAIRSAALGRFQRPDTPVYLVGYDIAVVVELVEFLGNDCLCHDACLILGNRQLFKCLGTGKSADTD